MAVIFSAITGDRGETNTRSTLRPIHGVDAYLFTNIPGMICPRGWKLIKLENKDGLYARKLARYVKTHPHTLLPPHDVSVWIDGTVEVKVNDVFKKFCKFDNGIILRCAVHEKRTCTYQEIKTCKAMRLDPDITNFDAQQLFYEKEHFPWNWGMLLTRVIARKNCPDTQRFNELWWEQIHRFSVRDQCSVMYSLYKTKIIFDAIRSQPRCFLHHNHNRGTSRTYKQTIQKKNISSILKKSVSTDNKEKLKTKIIQQQEAAEAQQKIELQKKIDFEMQELTKLYHMSDEMRTMLQNQKEKERLKTEDEEKEKLKTDDFSSPILLYQKDSKKIVENNDDERSLLVALDELMSFI
jgi:hypothetical protein